MLNVLCDGRTELPAGTKREYASHYCGNFTFDGTTLTSFVDANSDPARFTVPQVRKVAFRGGPDDPCSARVGGERRQGES